VVRRQPQGAINPPRASALGKAFAEAFADVLGAMLSGMAARLA